MNTSKHSIRRSSGFTLVELVITIAVLAAASVGVLMVMTYTVGHSGEPVVRQQLIGVARAYLEEILLTEFSDPDGVGGETRPDFDDVMDYDALANNGCLAALATPQCPLGSCPCDQTGAPIDGLAGYSVAVTVTSDGGGLGVGGSVPNADAFRVDVTAAHASGQGLSISGYRANY